MELELADKNNEQQGQESHLTNTTGVNGQVFGQLPD